MIHELRTYTFARGTGGVRELERRFGNNLDIRLKYSKLGGFFHTEIGEDSTQVVHIWPYDGYANRAEAREAANKDESNRWPPGIAELFAKQQVEILLPAPVHARPRAPTGWAHLGAELVRFSGRSGATARSTAIGAGAARIARRCTRWWAAGRSRSAWSPTGSTCWRRSAIGRTATKSRPNCAQIPTGRPNFRSRAHQRLQNPAARAVVSPQVNAMDDAPTLNRRSADRASVRAAGRRCCCRPAPPPRPRRRRHRPRPAGQRSCRPLRSTRTPNVLPTYVPLTGGPTPDFASTGPEYEDGFLRYPPNAHAGLAQGPARAKVARSMRSR